MGDPIGPALGELRPRLTSVALRFARSREAAEDIVQSAFEKALRHRDQFRGQARLSTWMHRIVVNESLMWLRSEKRRSGRHVGLDEGAVPEPPSHEPDAVEGLEAAQRRSWLREGLARLPDDEREVLQRCALDGASYEDFGVEAGVGPAAAKSRAFRGRRRLRALLAAQEAGPF